MNWEKILRCNHKRGLSENQGVQSLAADRSPIPLHSIFNAGQMKRGHDRDTQNYKKTESSTNTSALHYREQHIQVKYTIFQLEGNCTAVLLYDHIHAFNAKTMNCLVRTCCQWQSMLHSDIALIIIVRMDGEQSAFDTDGKADDPPVCFQREDSIDRIVQQIAKQGINI